jgi:lysophospholipase L1-like esterase
MKSSRFLAKAATALVSVVLGTSLCEIALFILGFPPDPPIRITHPANYSEKISNIEFRYSFSTNSQGLRNREIPLKKKKDEFRILLAGDSIIQGIGMEMDKTIPALLEQKLNPGPKTVQVINGGLAGTAPLNYGRLIFHLLDIYDIDAVLISVFANDVYETDENTVPRMIHAGMQLPRSRVNRLMHFFWPRMYLVARNGFGRDGTNKQVAAAGTRDAVDSLDQIVREATERGLDRGTIEAWKSRVVVWLNTLTPDERVAALNGEFYWNILAYGLSRPDFWSMGIDINTPSARRHWEAMASVLEEIVNELRERGKPVALLYIPSKFQYDPTSHSPMNAWKVGGSDIRQNWLHGQLEIDRRLADFAASTQLPFLDLTDGFRRAAASGVDLNWKHDEHLNQEGNRFAADSIALWMKERRIFLDWR